MGLIGPSNTAARCSMCGINYPARKRVCEVKACASKLAQIGDCAPDEEWQAKVDTLNAEHASDGAIPAIDELREHRASMYERLGFSERAATLLADAQDDLGFPLYWGRVEKAMKRGATRMQVLRMFV